MVYSWNECAITKNIIIEKNPLAYKMLIISFLREYVTIKWICGYNILCLVFFFFLVENMCVDFYLYASIQLYINSNFCTRKIEKLKIKILTVVS